MPFGKQYCYRIPNFWQFLKILLLKLSCLAQNYVQAASVRKLFLLPELQNETHFFSLLGLGVPLECYLYLCRSIAKLEWQELLGCTLINGIVHFGQNEMCGTSVLPDGLAMAVSLKNLITFASWVKEFTTRKYFKFHDIKNNHYRTNKRAKKNKALAKSLSLLILLKKNSAIVKEQVVGWGAWTALEMWFSSPNRQDCGLIKVRQWAIL